MTIATEIENWSPATMPTVVIGKLARRLTRLVDDRLHAVGITAAQLPVLVALKNGERRTQKELAQIVGIEQPSMAQLLARMTRDGRIRREVAPGDRRSSLVSLTDETLRHLAPGRDALRALDEEACAGLSAAERDTLLGLLARIGANLLQDDRDPPRGDVT